jgi:DNA primase
LTGEHIRFIKRLTDNLIIAFDKDEAGQNAAGRGIDLALAQGMEVKVAIIPSGKDPADAVKENSGEWEMALDRAKHVIDFYLQSLTDRKNIEKIVLPYAVILPSEMEKAHWVREIAKKLNIKEEAIWTELRKAKFSPRTDLGCPEVGPHLEHSRFNLLRDRLFGFLLWQKNCENEEMKKSIEEIVERVGLDIDEIQAEKIIFEAELFYGGTECLKTELEKLVSEFEKEKIKAELIELTDKIKKCETEAARSEELETCLKEFYNLSKKLSDIKQ